MIEVVKSSGGLFPNPLEEGISFDIYSTFIEPPPILDTEMKVCFLLSLNSTCLSMGLSKGLEERKQMFFHFSLPVTFPS